MEFNNLHPNFSTEMPTILSDTRGVDFGPYLARIIYIVRRNWLAVIPESARQGEKGRTGVVFEILKDGSVPQLRLVASSGSDDLDRAAFNGIHASVPFPPLPADFTGNHLVLQFIFLYNIAPGGVGYGKVGGLGPGEGGGFGGGAYSVGGDISAPIPIYKPEPAYTEEARKAKYEGTVVLWIVVDASGAVTDCRVVKPLGLGLGCKCCRYRKDVEIQTRLEKRHAGSGARHGASRIPVRAPHTSHALAGRAGER